MFSAADLIEALRRRTRRSLRPLPPAGEFPPAWRDWFSDMATRPGRVSGAPADDLVGVLAARHPAVPPRAVEELGRWRAFTTLWRQDWQPAAGDERWPRIASTTGSLLVHLLFVAATALLLLRFPFVLPEADDARDGEEHVLQVEYIGEGTVAGGGGAAPEVPEDAPDAPAPAPGAAAAVPVAVAQPPAVAAARQDGAPAPDAPDPGMETVPPALPVREPVLDVPVVAAPAVQVPARELQVTEVDVADSRFQVPPPREVAVDAPDAAAREVQPVARRIELQMPTEVELSDAGRVAGPAVPEAAPRQVTVRERSIELADAPGIQLDPGRELAEIRTREPGIAAPAPRERAVPMPAAGPAPAASPPEGRSPVADPGTQGTQGSRATSSATSGGAPADAGTGARGSDAVAGAGRVPGLPPGALPSTRANDDWGDSTRDVDGRQAGTPGAAGLFNSDGSPRLADGGGVGGGLPPGTRTEDYENIDRRGTWLKRPPIGYEPTSFDRFWLPSESLLEEWVRMSVTEVSIPIPGTTKSIRCVTVMLAMGGACGIVDPNLQEQPAQARTPPDVPFKRELQEDQDSLGPAPAPRP